MIGKIRKGTSLLIFAIPLLAIILAGCGSNSISPEDLAEMYSDAITDAKNPDADKISFNLTAIVPSEPNLIWEGSPGKSRILVISNMSEDAYERFGYKDAFESGDEYTLYAKALAWVTVVPEAILYFKNLGYTADGVTELRLAQALGLPAPSNERMIVGFMVNPEDIFRPCPDPEINDHECALDFPSEHSGELITFNDETKLYESAPCEEDGCTYDSWFDHRRNIVYTGDSAFPWTQLGYTYDWGLDAPYGNIGISEFAVKGGSVFNVVSADKVADYFLENWDNY